MRQPEYNYIGPVKLLESLSNPSPRFLISNRADLLSWASNHLREELADGTVPATYIIDPKEMLWIADRRSEHVICARGGSILMAGEIFIGVAKGRVWVERISNQSTGYCPAPDYQVLQIVLDRLGINHPGQFEPACEFRQCSNCGQINLIKEDDYTCAVCGNELSSKWFGPSQDLET